MHKIIIISWALVLCLFCSCKEMNYKKTRGGMPYKVFSGKDGKKLIPGEFIRVDQSVMINDSLVFDTRGKLPIYFRVDSVGQPYDPSEVFSQLRVGDSVVTVQLIDTFMKRFPGQVPPIYKKGDKIITHYKITGAFQRPELYAADLEKQKQGFLDREIKEIGDYLSRNNIPAQKTSRGTFVHIREQGTGAEVDSGKYVTVNYTGKTFDGRIFDSNTIDSFGHKQPLVVGVDITPMGVAGFTDGMKLLRQGSNAVLYIPSMLAYAALPPQGSGIPAFGKLIFEMQVLGVSDKAPVQTDPQPPMDSTHQH